MKTSKLIGSSILAIAIMASCSKKDDTSDSANAQQDVQDVAIAMNGSMELDMMSDMSLDDDSRNKAEGVMACASFTADFTGEVNTITLNFGEDNCQGEDGKYRRGMLEIAFPDNWAEAGASHTITATGYGINDYVYNGTRTVTYNGLNEDNNPSSSVSSNLTIDKPNNGGKIVWNSSRMRVWDEGFADGNPWNNKVSITGNASGTAASGTSFNADILDALVVAANCSNVVAGQLNISSNSFDTRVIDYGNGDCDNEATLTVNGNTVTFRLK